MEQIVPIILLGGSGTRLWPVSRKSHPKQFLRLADEYSLLQSTLLRLKGIEALAQEIVICNETHRFLTAEQLREIGHLPKEIILEPVGRNTAPALTIAALRAVAQTQADPVLLVLPADHLIQDQAAFQTAVAEARKAALQGNIVTFGIHPTRPETGYGYIEVETNKQGLCKIHQFVEKPDVKTAESYIDAGRFFWNSGMFMLRASVWLEEIRQHDPDMLSCCQAALDKGEADLDFFRLEKQAFEACPSDSIDYAVMEKTQCAMMVSLDAGWSDVGSWSALWEVKEKGEDGAVLEGDTMAINVRNCYAKSEHKLVALLNVEDLVVVETKDAVLVARMNDDQGVKTLVDELSRLGRDEADKHREVYRPWGKYDCLDAGTRFQVKRITLKPGESTSLQIHHHRSEHWIIVRGVAEITCDEKVFLCCENESAYIPLGASHRIANPGKLPMEMIEVQTGSYLGEDDIVRLDDYYGRSEPKS